MAMKNRHLTLGTGGWRFLSCIQSSKTVRVFQARTCFSTPPILNAYKRLTYKLTCGEWEETSYLAAAIKNSNH
jgi:hypothetical protein